MRSNETAQVQWQQIRAQLLRSSDQRSIQRFSRLQTRKRRRLLVAATALAPAAMLLMGIGAACQLIWMSSLAIPAAVIGFSTAYPLQVLARDRTAEVLDELELAERDRARTVAVYLAYIPLLATAIFLWFAAANDGGRPQLQAGAWFIIAAINIWSLGPMMILGWTRRDPEPGERN